MFCKNIIAAIKFMSKHKLFKKKEHQLTSYMLWRDTPKDDLTATPCIISDVFLDEYNFVDQEIKLFLNDLRNEFWIKPSRYGMKFINMDNDDIVKCVDFTDLDFTELVLIYLALLSKKITFENTDDYRIFTAVVSCIHQYVINCSKRNKRKVLKVFNDPLFGNLIMEYMKLHSDSIREYSIP